MSKLIEVTNVEMLIFTIYFDVVLILYYIPNQTNLICRGPTLTLWGLCNDVSNDVDVVNVLTLVTSINFDVNIYDFLTLIFLMLGPRTNDSRVVAVFADNHFIAFNGNALPR